MDDRVNHNIDDASSQERILNDNNIQVLNQPRTDTVEDITSVDERKD